jgi:hypothetical protein
VSRKTVRNEVSCKTATRHFTHFSSERHSPGSPSVLCSLHFSSENVRHRNQTVSRPGRRSVPSGYLDRCVAEVNDWITQSGDVKRVLPQSPPAVSLMVISDHRTHTSHQQIHSQIKFEPFHQQRSHQILLYDPSSGNTSASTATATATTSSPGTTTAPLRSKGTFSSSSSGSLGDSSRGRGRGRGRCCEKM